MERQGSVRADVIARLMTRHGLSAEEAARAWEEFSLRLRGIRLTLDPKRGIDDN